MPTRLEIAIANNLRRIKFAPGSPDKRFLSNVRAMAEHEMLSSKQHRYVLRCAKRYRRQLPSGPFLKQAIVEDARYAEMGEVELGFADAINESPYEWDTRIAYADLLEERGDERGAATQRLFVQIKECYSIKPGGSSYGPEMRGINHSWFWHSHVSLSFSMKCGTWHDTRLQAESSVAENIHEHPYAEFAEVRRAVQ